MRLITIIKRVAVPTRNTLRKYGMLGPLDAKLSHLSRRFQGVTKEGGSVLLDGGLVLGFPPGLPSAESLMQGRFEPEVTRVISSVLELGMTFVDVGANIGYYALLAGRICGPDGSVIAFEPDDAARAVLASNVAANSLDNVEICALAVSDRSERGRFFPADYEGGSLVQLGAGGAGVEVETTTLDDFFSRRGWPRVDVVKLDIEGAEMLALSGMAELCERNPGVMLVMESNPYCYRRAGVTPVALGQKLHDLGFTRGWVIERGMKVFALPEGYPRGQALCNLLLKR